MVGIAHRDHYWKSWRDQLPGGNAGTTVLLLTDESHGHRSENVRLGEGYYAVDGRLPDVTVSDDECRHRSRKDISRTGPHVECLILLSRVGDGEIACARQPERMAGTVGEGGRASDY